MASGSLGECLRSYTLASVSEVFFTVHVLSSELVLMSQSAALLLHVVHGVMQGHTHVN